MGKFIISNNSSSIMKLNESLSNKEQYILEGIFAQFDVENRNGRVYTKNEYLPHLQYLRSDLKQGESLLGELDHPEDRFEVSLQNASHQILDLWLDESKNCVMGKIKLLDTPSGKIAKSLIDDGVPLHISSRAAGSVDPQTKKVSIQQIFTYDLVAKPGFASAVLYRVNESASSKSYSVDTINFLKESIKNEAFNQAQQYNIINENLMIREVFGTVNIRPEAQDIDINNKINIEDMTSRINESNDVTFVGSDEAAKQMGIEQPDMTLESSENDEQTPVEETTPEANDDINAENTDETSEENLILGVKAEYNPMDNLILEVKPEFVSVEEETSEETETEAEESKENEDESNETEAKSEESVEENTEETSKETEDDSVKEEESVEENSDETEDDKEEVKPTEKNTLNDEDEEGDKIKNKKEKVLSEVNDLIANLKKKKEVKESQFAKYPFTKYMNESEYAKFDNLDWKQKEKVNEYIIENCLVDADSINRLWEGALYSKTIDEPIWLKNAPAEYRNLYENASKKVQDDLAACASYLIFESQYDIDLFWENSNLKRKHEIQRLNESHINILSKSSTVNGLPYGEEFVNEITKQTLAITEK